MKIGKCRKFFGGMACWKLRRSANPRRRCAFDKKKIDCPERAASEARETKNDLEALTAAT